MRCTKILFFFTTNVLLVQIMTLCTNLKSILPLELLQFKKCIIYFGISCSLMVH